jgi:hypothetical protein
MRTQASRAVNRWPIMTHGMIVDALPPVAWLLFYPGKDHKCGSIALR